MQPSPIRLPNQLPRLLLPRDTVCGVGSVVALRSVPSSQILILSGRSLPNVQLERLNSNLRGDSTKFLVRPDGEPTLGTVQQLLQELDGFSPDCIIAVGAGSTIDTAKLMMLFLELPETDLDGFQRPFSLPPLKRKARFIAVPTTTGSGAEASSAALYTEETSGSKIPVVTHDFLPDLCIIDPSFLREIPKDILASSILDAITHAVEAYISRVANPLAESLAEKAIQIIGSLALQGLSDHLEDESLLQLQIASYYAGIAQNHCGVGCCHSLAHQLSRYGIYHGTANGIFLGRVLELNREEPGVPARINKLVKIGQIESISKLTKDVQELGGLPRSLSEVVPSVKVDANVIANGALADVCSRFNPRKLTEEEFLRLAAPD